MRIPSIVRLDRPSRALVDRVIANRRGVAAVEFALIVPIMFMLLVGTVEFSQALTVDRRVSQVASSSADLIARQKAITTSEVAGIMKIIDHLLRPYDPTRLRVTVLNVMADVDDANNTTVCWSYEHNGGAGSYAAGASYPLPAGMIEPGGSVIITEVTYDYQPIIFDYFIQSIFLEDKLFLKPRLSSYVEYNGNTCS
ncbi:MAG: pilus assembly protein [Hyphomicrobiaceae bacterium]|nr:pilus assembly protein [Hyphomicrobiaceae bacterium]